MGFIFAFSCKSKKQGETTTIAAVEELPKTTYKDSIIFTNQPVLPGAYQTKEYISLLTGKNIGMVVNPTSMVGNTHLVDSFLKMGLQVKKIFAPEHGFRGDHSAGAKVSSTIDEKTKIPIISLYGSHKKPTKDDYKDIDYMVFDMQDVGVRFYTFLSTMHYVMEACAENNVPLLILDRPNPNGFYVDGPILEPAFKSFVGIHPIPIVHGMTLGELSLMINGEGWLENKVKADVKIIHVRNYHHNRRYKIPVKPSPNLPSQASIYLYPSLCLFEGTNVSVGRGTPHPFECFGKPGLKEVSYKFTPKNIPGVADNPPFKNQECNGVLLTSFGENYIPNFQKLYLEWLILTYKQAKANNETFFNDFFNKLAGNATLRKQIEDGKTQDQIFESWKAGLDAFKKQREPYLLYDFKENAGLFD